MNALWVFISILALLSGIVIGSLIWSHGGPWLPTNRSNIRKMLVLARVQAGETVYDLGCGDGRVLVLAAREFGVKGMGFEIDWMRYHWARLNVRLAGMEDKITIVHGNFFKQDLSEADIVFTFLLQKIQNKLVLKLSKELKPGARIVTNTFIMPGWQPVEKDADQQLYLYQIPDKPHPSV